MTPQQKIKYLVIEHVCFTNAEIFSKYMTGAEVDEFYDSLNGEDVTVALYEIREGEWESDIPCEHSRHYESKSVASRCPNGEWVGWTYWYGGGKHGESEAIDWVGEAYHVEMTEEVEIVYKFSKKEKEDV